MRESLGHRGPDANGSVFFPELRVGLGHRRLRIIDLSPLADQPMSQEDGQVWVVFNGEIYNFQQLRVTLEASGHRFRTHSDTEVILHAYEEWGTDCFARLCGMFGLALLDRRLGHLILARDHVGIKPLYYCRQNGRFTFGSEIKAILASGSYSPDIDWQSIHDYFTFLYVPGPETAFRGILQVPPAHWLRLDLASGAVDLQEYWRVGASFEDSEPGADREELDAVRCRELLRSSVRRQMVSDVPLGLFLSGGIDSAIVAGLVAECSSDPVKTYTVVFTTPGSEMYDERDAARRVARHFATEHCEVAIDLKRPEGMLDLVGHFDQPFANPTSYLMYLISKQARSELTVALCGAGGDEVYGGYPRHRVIASPWLRRIPLPVAYSARRLLNIVGDDGGVRRRRLRKLVDGCVEQDRAGQLLRWTYFLGEREKAALLVPGRSVQPSQRVIQRHLDATSGGDEGNRALQVELRTFLPDNVLEYTDKMSMAVGLEVRVPYLDPRVIEHSLSLPFRRKVNHRGSKVVLKEAFASLLPPGHCQLPKKGFNAPLAAWMRDSLDGYFDRFMGPVEVRREGIFSWEYIQQLRLLHRSAKRNLSNELFSVIVFDVWYRRHILGETTDLSLQ